MRQLRSGRVAAIALVMVILLTTAIAAVPVFAQEGTPLADLPVLTEQPSPEASPDASPVAASDFEPAEFVAGAWRIAVVTADQNVEFADFELPARDDKDWIIVIADVTNWSRSDAILDPRAFAIRTPESDEARGFARRSTERVAEDLDLEPVAVDEGVTISAGETVRVALTFEAPQDVLNPVLVIGESSMSLGPAIAGGAPLLALPDDIVTPGETVRQNVEEIIDGATLGLGASSTPTVLSFVDAPTGEECFGSQASGNLTRLTTERVFVEADGDDRYIWTEEDDGTRRLLNYEQIRSGFAAASADLHGRFELWFRDAEELAKRAAGGIWGACSGPHGVVRTTSPERTTIRMSDGDGGTTSYRVWLEWSPELVTTPDGGAWAFFSALADDGAYKDKQLLYASHFDPRTGQWTPAEPMPAGEIQFGASAVIDSRGLVHVVYSAREQTGPQYLSTVIYTHEDGRGGWASPMAVSLDQLAGHQIAPSLAIDSNDRLYVAFQDQRAFSDQGRASSPLNADVFVSQKDPDGSWTTPVLINNHLPTAAALLPRLVVDGDRIVAVWSVYTAALGPDNAARMEWAQRDVNADLVDWSAPKVFANGRGDTFGGRFVDMAADPTGGVVVTYARRGIDTFLFLRRLMPGDDSWTADTLIAFGDRGTFPTVEINNQGVIYVGYNANTGVFGETNETIVDVGAAAIAYRSLEPGNEIILTRDDPNSQGRPVIAIDVTGKPWFVFFGQIPGGYPSTQVGVLRNANIPILPVAQPVIPDQPAVAPAPAASPEASPEAASE
ncbi:MAG: hypothetical protein IT335_10075 [Thermomicrobiales bacterium]|nr:hypothetical protein [Thermomicrobiales bacterium]